MKWLRILGQERGLSGLGYSQNLCWSNSCAGCYKIAYLKKEKRWSFRSYVLEPVTRPCFLEPEDSERALLPACRVLLYLYPRLLETQKAIHRQSRSALSLRGLRGLHISLLQNLVEKGDLTKNVCDRVLKRYGEYELRRPN